VVVPFACYSHNPLSLTEGGVWGEHRHGFPPIIAKTAPHQRAGLSEVVVKAKLLPLLDNYIRIVPLFHVMVFCLSVHVG
jgi:hypothetical protein